MEHMVRTMAIPAILMMAPATALVAQTLDDPAQHIAFHIDGFSSTERDAIAVEIAMGGEFRMSYACVPAGILVIEPIAAGASSVLSTHGEALVRKHIGTRTLVREAKTITELEQACTQVRSQ